MNLEENQPRDLEHAIEILTEAYEEHISEIRNMSEGEFQSSTHFWSGMAVRNAWNLWWYADHNYPNDWPEEKPPIVEWFNNIDIVHADDMSGMIMTSLHRSIGGKKLDIEGQVEKYHTHWKEAGYENGIPRD